MKGKDYFLSFFNSPPSEEKNKKLTRVFLTDAAAAVVARIVVATPTDNKHHRCVVGGCEPVAGDRRNIDSNINIDIKSLSSNCPKYETQKYLLRQTTW